MIDEKRQIWGRCPECGADLIIITNYDTHREHLACRRAPRCEYRRDVPPEVQMVRAGAEKLPGF